MPNAIVMIVLTGDQEEITAAANSLIVHAKERTACKVYPTVTYTYGSEKPQTP